MTTRISLGLALSVLSSHCCKVRWPLASFATTLVFTFKVTASRNHRQSSFALLTSIPTTCVIFPAPLVHAASPALLLGAWIPFKIKDELAGGMLYVTASRAQVGHILVPRPVTIGS